MPFVRRADALIRYKILPPAAGKPAWMNLKASRLLTARDPDLRGPGIYGLFLDDRLFYVGVYAGRAEDPFGGSVLHARWHMHFAYHLLRSPDIVFAPAQLNAILRELDGPVATAFAQQLGGRDVDCRLLDPALHPLVAPRDRRGRQNGNCTHNKVRFAERHWDVVGPDAGDPAMLAERLSVRYHVLPAARAAALPAGLGDGASQWVKAQWLFPAETRLIDMLRPACNAETLAGTERDDVTGALFDEAVLAAFAEPVVGGGAAAALPQPAGDIVDVTDDRLADDAAPPEAPMLDEEGSPVLAPDAIDDGGDRSILDRLEDAAPHRFTVYPTGRDHRIGLTGVRKRPVVLLTLAARTGGFACRSKATVAQVRALGFAGRPAAPGTGMTSAFDFDTAGQDPASLVAVAILAAAPILDGR